MKLRFTEKADQDFADLPVAIRKAFGKQLCFLLDNRGHPSLHAKKYSGALDGAKLVSLKEPRTLAGPSAKRPAVFLPDESKS